MLTLESFHLPLKIVQLVTQIPHVALKPPSLDNITNKETFNRLDAMPCWKNTRAVSHGKVSGIENLAVKRCHRVTQYHITNLMLHTS